MNVSDIAREAAEATINQWLTDSLTLERGYGVPAEHIQSAINRARADTLKPANCEVSGHFRFQENGGICMMCQREDQLVNSARSADVQEIERLCEEVYKANRLIQQADEQQDQLRSDLSAAQAAEERARAVSTDVINRLENERQRNISFVNNLSSLKDDLATAQRELADAKASLGREYAISDFYKVCKELNSLRAQLEQEKAKVEELKKGHKAAIIAAIETTPKQSQPVPNLSPEGYLDYAESGFKSQPGSQMDKDGHCMICGCEVREYEGGTDEEAIAAHKCPPGFSQPNPGPGDPAREAAEATINQWITDSLTPERGYEVPTEHIQSAIDRATAPLAQEVERLKEYSFAVTRSNVEVCHSLVTAKSDLATAQRERDEAKDIAESHCATARDQYKEMTSLRAQLEGVKVDRDKQVVEIEALKGETKKWESEYVHAAQARDSLKYPPFTKIPLDELWTQSTDHGQPLPQYIAGYFHPRWREIRESFDQQRQEIEALRKCVVDVSDLDNAKLALEAVRTENAALAASNEIMWGKLEYIVSAECRDLSYATEAANDALSIPHSDALKAWAKPLVEALKQIGALDNNPVLSAAECCVVARNTLAAAGEK